MGQHLAKMKDGIAGMTLADLDVRKCMCPHSASDPLPGHADDNYMYANNTFMEGAYEEHPLGEDALMSAGLPSSVGNDPSGPGSPEREHVLVMADDVASNVENPFGDIPSNPFGGLPTKPQQDNF